MTVHCMKCHCDVVFTSESQLWACQLGECLVDVCACISVYSCFGICMGCVCMIFMCLIVCMCMHVHGCVHVYACAWLCCGCVHVYACAWLCCGCVHVYACSWLCSWLCACIGMFCKDGRGPARGHGVARDADEGEGGACRAQVNPTCQLTSPLCPPCSVSFASGPSESCAVSFP
jgi:hypothetical protein